jgi:capsular polysaccharide transport system permease protein
MDANGWLRRIYSRPEADYLSRFDADESFEQLWKFWGSKVSSSVDMISGIVTVRVAAFTREDALAVAQEVTRHAERVVNDYSGRLRVDAMTNAEREIALAAERYRNALLALRDFRDTDRVVDPLKASVATVEMLLQVRIQRVAVERERAVTARLTSDQAPPTQFLAERVKALDQQIAKLQTQLTADRDSVKAANVILAKYEELELARLFASELLSVAIKAYQKARSEVERQQVYLSVFVPPAAPQLAMYPRRGVNTALVFFSALITWGILWLVVAGARDQML